MTTQTATAEKTVTQATAKPNKAKSPKPQAQPANPIIRFKQNLEVHFMSEYLSYIHHSGLMCDKEFNRLLKQLEDYTNSLIDIPDGLDLLDSFAIIECEKVDEKAFNDFVKSHITWFE